MFKTLSEILKHIMDRNIYGVMVLVALGLSTLFGALTITLADILVQVNDLNSQVVVLVSVLDIAVALQMGRVNSSNKNLIILYSVMAYISITGFAFAYITDMSITVIYLIHNTTGLVGFIIHQVIKNKIIESVKDKIDYSNLGVYTTNIIMIGGAIGLTLSTYIAKNISPVIALIIITWRSKRITELLDDKRRLPPLVIGLFLL